MKKSFEDIVVIQNRLNQAYNSENFYSLALDTVEQSKVYLSNCSAGKVSDLKKQRQKDSSVLQEIADSYLCSVPKSTYLEQGPGFFLELRGRLNQSLSFFLENARKIHAPTYMGHQVPPPIPIAGLALGVVGIANQGRAVYEMSPSGAVIETAIIRAMLKKLSWNVEYSDGIATSGGTAANFTAILAARHKISPTSWESGISSDHNLCILCSEDSHYSVSRAAGIIGIGTNRVIKVPVDETRRMTALALKQKAEEVESLGMRICCVIASAPSTPIGAIDELDQIGKLCQLKKWWLHVDAVHGATFLFSSTYKGRLNGIELADSVAWDAHKMMHVPSLSTFLLFRERGASFLAFKQEASYLFNANPSHDDNYLYDGALRTFECTKPAIGLPVWLLWSLFGETIFSDIVDACMGLTEKFHELLRESLDFECYQNDFEPQTNIICFRYVPENLKSGADLQKINQFQKNVRKSLLNCSDYYITQTDIQGQTYLRTTIINPLSRYGDFEKLLEAIREVSLNA